METITSNSPEHKAGFVNIVGNPNVGKSTLMNPAEILQMAEPSEAKRQKEILQETGVPKTAVVLSGME